MPVALRYTFAFDTTSLRMLRRLALDKQTVASLDWEAVAGESGFWVELRDASDQLLYRRVLDDPAYRLEGPINDNGAMRAVPPAPGRTGTFSVVVPYTPDTTRLVIMASRPPDAPAAAIVNITVEPA